METGNVGLVLSEITADECNERQRNSRAVS